MVSWRAISSVTSPRSMTGTGLMPSLLAARHRCSPSMISSTGPKWRTVMGSMNPKDRMDAIAFAYISSSIRLGFHGFGRSSAVSTHRSSGSVTTRTESASWHVVLAIGVFIPPLAAGNDIRHLIFGTDHAQLRAANDERIGRFTATLANEYLAHRSGHSKRAE